MSTATQSLACIEALGGEHACGIVGVRETGELKSVIFGNGRPAGGRESDAPAVHRTYPKYVAQEYSRSHRQHTAGPVESCHAGIARRYWPSSNSCILVAA